MSAIQSHTLFRIGHAGRIRAGYIAFSQGLFERDSARWRVGADGVVPENRGGATLRWLLSLALILSVACTCVHGQDRTSSASSTSSTSSSQSPSPAQTGKAGPTLAKPARV